jgi:hypothetical protein
MKDRWACAIGQIGMLFALLFPFDAWCAQSPPRAIKPNGPAVAQWEARSSSIQKMLEESDEENCRGAPPAGIVDAFGTSGEALSVALVDFCGRGAYTELIVVMRMDHGKPVLAKFRDAKGKRIENSFLSGASVMHSVDVKLVEAKKAIYDSFADNDAEGKPAQCGVKAYVWNAKTETFDLDLRLSKTASDEYCRSVHEK